MATVRIFPQYTNFVIESKVCNIHSQSNRDNPNAIKEQTFTLTVPTSPSKASADTRTPMGPVGMATNGVAIFNVYTIEGTDAVVYEVFDSCDGHPDPQGYYHYHQIPDCIYKGGNDEFIGVALDGFSIYGPKDASGKELTSADLDNCHGTDYNGAYRYHLTRDFPYTVGCFKGAVTLSSRQLQNCKIATADSAGTGSVGTGSAGTGTAGTGTAGMGSTGTGTAGTRSSGTGSAGAGHVAGSVLASFLSIVICLVYAW